VGRRHLVRCEKGGRSSGFHVRDDGRLDRRCRPLDGDDTEGPFKDPRFFWENMGRPAQGGAEEQIGLNFRSNIFKSSANSEEKIGGLGRKNSFGGYFRRGEGEKGYINAGRGLDARSPPAVTISGFQTRPGRRAAAGCCPQRSGASTLNRVEGDSPKRQGGQTSRPDEPKPDIRLRGDKVYVFKKRKNVPTIEHTAAGRGLTARTGIYWRTSIQFYPRNNSNLSERPHPGPDGIGSEAILRARTVKQSVLRPHWGSLTCVALSNPGRAIWQRAQPRTREGRGDLTRGTSYEAFY